VRVGGGAIKNHSQGGEGEKAATCKVGEEGKLEGKHIMSEEKPQVKT